MPKIGARVKILHPEYARELEGAIVAKEQVDFWMIRLDKAAKIRNEKNLPDSEPWLLSLGESDFEVIGRRSRKNF